MAYWPKKTPKTLGYLIESQLNMNQLHTRMWCDCQNIIVSNERGHKTAI